MNRAAREKLAEAKGLPGELRKSAEALRSGYANGVLAQAREAKLRTENTRKAATALERQGEKALQSISGRSRDPKPKELAAAAHLEFTARTEMLERESILPGLREHETVAADAHKRTGELTGVTSRAKDVVQTYGSRAADAIRFVVKIEKQGKEAIEKRQRDLDAARRELAELCDLCARIRQRLGLSAEDE